MRRLWILGLVLCGCGGSGNPIASKSIVEWTGTETEYSLGYGQPISRTDSINLSFDTFGNASGWFIRDGVLCAVGGRIDRTGHLVASYVPTDGGAEGAMTAILFLKNGVYSGSGKDSELPPKCDISLSLSPAPTGS